MSDSLSEYNSDCMSDTNSEITNGDSNHIESPIESLMSADFPENTQDMEGFLTYCDRAHDYVSDEEKPSLLDYIKTKISGRAKEQLANHEFASWEELREWLKSFYAIDPATGRPNYERKLQPLKAAPLRFELCAILLFNDDVDYVEVRSIKARQNRFRLMIDTGASVNLIKLTSLTPDVAIDVDEKVVLMNITPHQNFHTSGSCWLPVIVDNRRINVKFYIIDQLNNIPGDGLLGLEFMENEKVTINYMERTFTVNTINKTLGMYRT